MKWMMKIKCLRKLDGHFRAKDNVPYERHVFRQLAPTKGETADNFMVHLRKQAHHCNFGKALKKNLRYQLIEKLSDVELKKKLLKVKDISLAAAMEKVRKWEAAREQANQMVSPNQAPEAGTNAVEETSGMDLQEELSKSVSIMVKRVILLTIGIAPQTVESVLNVLNMGIMQAVAKEEKVQTMESKEPLNELGTDSTLMEKGDKPTMWRIL